MGVDIMENSMVVSKKIKSWIAIWPSNLPFGYITQGIENRVLKKYLYTHVHSSIIFSSPKVEATQVSTDGWMDK